MRRACRGRISVALGSPATSFLHNGVELDEELGKLLRISAAFRAEALSYRAFQMGLRELEEVIRLSNQRFGASQVVQFGSETAAAQIFFAVIELSFATFSHLGEHSSIVANNFILNQIKFVPEFALVVEFGN